MRFGWRERHVEDETETVVRRRQVDMQVTETTHINRAASKRRRTMCVNREKQKQFIPHRWVRSNGHHLRLSLIRAKTTPADFQRSLLNVSLSVDRLVIKVCNRENANRNIISATGLLFNHRWVSVDLMILKKLLKLISLHIWDEMSSRLSTSLFTVNTSGGFRVP